MVKEDTDMSNILEGKDSLMNTYASFPVVLDHGIGSKLYDVDGKEYIDFTSGIGVSSLGYGHEGWVNAVTAQAKKLAHTSNIYLHAPVLNLAKKITEVSDMSKVFFANSGAEANEGAIKLARKYSYDKYGEGRSTIITLNKSFHGRTITTLKATGQEKFHKFFYPFTEGFKYADANDIDSLNSCIDDSVCAIMIEAIQGEGGVNPLNKEFVDEIFNIAAKKDLLVIFDEVQCGIGRTGKLYGFDNFGVKPDIISLAKGLGAGLPIGAVLCNEKLAKTFTPGDHGSTFGGNPIAVSGASEVLNVVADDNFLYEVAAKGNYIKDFFKQAATSKVVEVRGMGLMIGIEVTEEASKIQKLAMDKGLLVLTAGPKVVRLLPPLVISKEELETGLNILLNAIESI